MGQQNYKLFIVFTLLAIAYNIIHLIFLGFALSHLLESTSFNKDYNQDLTLAWISVILPVPLMGFLFYLLGFHAWITYQGFSTYEYIFWKRLRDRLSAKIKVSYKPLP